MPLAAIVGVLVGVALLTSLALALLGGRREGARTRSQVALSLRLAAAVVTVVVALLLGPEAWRDSGAFALALVGIPTACALLVLVPTLTGAPTRLATWVAAVIMLVWSLLTALGLGLYLLGPALLMVMAAVASTRDPAAASLK